MLIPTGTFFWDMTTAQLFPRTPMEVMFAAVMALKAYSACDRESADIRWRGSRFGKRQSWIRTNLVETALVGEDGDVSVETCAS
jgi:hypothetical protein